MTYSLFIDTEYFYNMSGVSNNIDVNRIEWIIKRAQTINVFEELGKDLYDKIFSDIQSQSLSGDYLTLRNIYIAPYIVELGRVYLYESSFVEMTNMGIQAKRTEWTNSVNKLNNQNNINDIKRLENRLRTYLKDNISKFPEYRGCYCSLYNRPNNPTGFITY